MIIRVIELAAASRDDAPGAAVARARRRYRVFAVVPARSFRQLALAIAERRAVAGIRKRAAGADQVDRSARLRGQLAQCDVAGESSGRAEPQGEQGRGA